jgi:hypothetical protein
MAEYEEKLERMTSLNKDDLKILERLLDEWGKQHYWKKL